MSAELLDKLTDALAEQVVAKAGPKLLAYLEERRTAKQDDPLFTVAQAAKHIGLSANSVRRLVDAEEITRAPGFAEIRIRRSELDKYGTSK